MPYVQNRPNQRRYRKVYKPFRSMYKKNYAKKKYTKLTNFRYKKWNPKTRTLVVKY